MKKNTRKYVISFLLMLLVVYFLVGFRMPYYIYKPGSADALEPIVQVDNGTKSTGSMHMVTVSGGQATLLGYALAKLQPHDEIVPIEEVKPKGITDEAYMHAQLQMMEGSQEAATVVAYQAAHADIDIDYQGVYVVSVLKGMPAAKKLKAGDRIIAIDQAKVRKAEDLTAAVADRKAGDKITIRYIRKKKEQTAVIELQALKALGNKVGMGIQLVTDRKVNVEPEVHFSSGDVGGPSAGLMFSLQIYDQLKAEDLTKGYSIAGTGEIDYNGNVQPIGGIDKKIIAADKEGCDIFFAPNEHGKKDSNYKVAKATAKEIGSSMKVIPVDSFSDALHYLEKLKTK